MTLSGGASTVRGLAINRFGGPGILIPSGNGNTIESNFLGTDVTGTLARGNDTGIVVQTANNVIGGTTPGARNLISGNTFSGIQLLNAGATGNQVVGNIIGTDLAVTATRPNGNAGVQLIASDGGFSGSGNVIGGPTVAHRNIISGNNGGGVVMRRGATNNRVQGNYIGTNADGTIARANNNAGVFIAESSNNFVENNLLSGNGGVGLVISATLQAPGVATGNVIRGNLIGTDAAGSAALPNNNGGVRLDLGASGNTIGGTGTGARNVIAGNNANGISLQSGANNNTIQGNAIGVNAAGTIDLGNVANGIHVNGVSGTVIGGTSAAARNIVSGNNGGGIRLSQATTTNTSVQGNYVGVGATGTLAIGNSSDGITVETGANENTIGGTAVRCRQSRLRQRRQWDLIQRRGRQSERRPRQPHRDRCVGHHRHPQRHSRREHHRRGRQRHRRQRDRRAQHHLGQRPQRHLDQRDQRRDRQHRR